MRLQVALQSGINYIRRQDQRHFAQRRHLRRRSFGGSINDHNFIRPIEKLPRDGFNHWPASQFLCCLALVCDVLQVH